MESHQHTADAQLVREAYGDPESINEMKPGDFKKTIESLLQKIRNSDSHWTMLQMRNGALRSELDALITSASPSVANAQTQTDENDVGNAVTSEKDPQESETAVVTTAKSTVGGKLPRSEVADDFPRELVLGGEAVPQDIVLSRDTMRQIDAIQDGIQTECGRYRELINKLLQRISVLGKNQTQRNINDAAVLPNNAVLELFSHTCPVSIVDAKKNCKCSMPKALRSDDPLWKGTPWTQRSCIAFVRYGRCDKENSGQTCFFAHDYRTERTRLESKEARKAHTEANRLEMEFQNKFGDSYRILQAQLRYQSELMMNGMLQVNVRAITEQFAITDEGVATVVPQTTHHGDVASPNISSTAPRSSGGGHPKAPHSRDCSNNENNARPTISIQPASQSPELRSRKRAHAVSAGAGNESDRNHQKRRTGFANYVELSNPAWQQGAAPATISRGFGSFNGDFRPSPNPREDTSEGKSGTMNSPTMKASLGPYVVQSRKTASSPTSPRRDSLQVPDFGIETSQINKPMARIVNFRTNTEVQNPGRVPTGPRKWQNPPLKKDR